MVDVQFKHLLGKGIVLLLYPQKKHVTIKLVSLLRKSPYMITTLQKVSK